MTSIPLRARRGLRLRGAELLLWAVIAGSLAFGLSAVLGPNGLGLMTIRPQWPVIGQSVRYEHRDPAQRQRRISIANALG